MKHETIKLTHLLVIKGLMISSPLKSNQYLYTFTFAYCHMKKKFVDCSLTHLHRDLSNGPCSIITHRNELWVQVEPQDGHELRWGSTGNTGYNYGNKWLYNSQLLCNDFTKINRQCNVGRF